MTFGPVWSRGTLRSQLEAKLFWVSNIMFKKFVFFFLNQSIFIKSWYIIHKPVIAFKSSIEEVGINLLQRKQKDKARNYFLLPQNIHNWLQDYDKIIKIFPNKILLRHVYSKRQTCATHQPAYQNKYISTNPLPTNPLVKHIFLTAWKFIPNMKHRGQFLKLQTIKNGSNLFPLFSSSPA